MNDGMRDWWRGVRAAWHYGRGKGAYKRGDFAAATRRFRESEELAPGNLDVQSWVAKSKRAERERCG